jgi:hypothetical protein
MKAAKNIVGFVVLSEGKAIRNCGDSDPRFRYLSNFGLLPIAIFPSRKIARRVKHLLYLRFTDIANRMDPNKDEHQKRCFELWVKRARELRICAVRSEAPTVADLRIPKALSKGGL